MLNQNQLAELFDTSVPNIAIHIKNILEDNELDEKSVIKDYLITAADGKKYNTALYNATWKPFQIAFLLYFGLILFRIEKTIRWQRNATQRNANYTLPD